MPVSRFFQNLSNRIKAGALRKPVTGVLGRIAEDAREKAPTSRIKEAIKVEKVQVLAGGTISGGVSVDLDIAPEARAYEKGSGIHATEGTKEKYPIHPRNKQALAFFWDKTPSGPGSKYIGTLEDGRKLFTFVEHPGVAARPYLLPAAKENAKLLGGLVTLAIVEEIEAMGISVRL